MPIMIKIQSRYPGPLGQTLLLNETTKRTGNDFVLPMCQRRPRPCQRETALVECEGDADQEGCCNSWRKENNLVLDPARHHLGEYSIDSENRRYQRQQHFDIVMCVMRSALPLS